MDRKRNQATDRRLYNVCYLIHVGRENGFFFFSTAQLIFVGVIIYFVFMFIMRDQLLLEEMIKLKSRIFSVKRSK